MENIKKKMNVLRDKLEAAEERELIYKREFSQRNDTANRAEEEVISLKRQLYLREKELDAIEDLDDQKRDRLLNCEDVIERNVRRIKVLDKEEEDNESQIEQLEIRLKQAEAAADFQETKYRDTTVKLANMTDEYHRTCVRLERANLKIETLSAEYGLKARNTRVLADNEDRLAQREESLEKQHWLLDNSIKDVDMRAEHAERQNRRLEKDAGALKNKINWYRVETEKLRDELHGTLKDLDQM